MLCFEIPKLSDRLLIFLLHLIDSTQKDGIEENKKNADSNFTEDTNHSEVTAIQVQKFIQVESF